MSGLKQPSLNSKSEFREIFKRYYQPLYHLSSYYIDNQDEAKGVVQEAFIKLWEVRAELSPDSNIKNFLFTLVKNNCLNILKRRQMLLKHHEQIRKLELRYHYESLNRVTDDYLDFKEAEARISAAVKKLPEHCREVFEMSRFQNMKNREIADKLGISQKAVEARMTKALKILRNELKDYLPLVLLAASFFD